MPSLVVLLLIVVSNIYSFRPAPTTLSVPVATSSLATGTKAQPSPVVHINEGTIYLFTYTAPVEVTIASVVSLINQDRTWAHGSVLLDRTSLNKVAQTKADDMVAQGYFAHTSPSGVKISTYDATADKFYWIDGTIDAYSYVGENLAEGFTDAQGQEAAWMASPTHRANILKPQYSYIGVGTASGICAQQDTCKGDYNKRVLFTVTVFAK